MALDENKILFQLVLKGIEPSEAHRIASLSGDALANAMGQQYAKLAALHAKAKTAEGDVTEKAAQREVKAATAMLAAMEKVRRAEEIAANKSSNAWRRVLEDLENVNATLELSGRMWGRVIQLPQKIVEFAEKVKGTAEIYGSLKGSITAASDALDGQMTEIELIQARNRAFQKDLKLTDEQFAAVATQAEAFSSALGTDVKDALDSLIDGLATGQTRLLKHVGIMVDAEEAQRKYAKSIGVTVEELTEQEKLQATQVAALDAIKKKNEELGESTMTVAKTIIAGWNAATNAITRAMAAIGSIDMSHLARAWAAFGLMPSGAAEAMDAQQRAAMNSASLAAQRGRQEADYARMQAGAEAAGLGEIGAAGSMFDDLQGTGFAGMGLVTGSFTGRGAMAGGPRRERGGGRKRPGMDSVEQLLYEASIDRRMEEGTGPIFKEESEEQRAEALRGAMEHMGEVAKQQTLATYQAIMEEAIENQTDRLRDAGIEEQGMMARLLFGAVGPEDLAAQVATFSDATLAVMGTISSMAESAAGALTEKLVGAMFGENVSLKKRLRDIAKAGATEMTIHGIMAAAKAFGLLFTNPVQAGHEAISAAKYFGAAAAIGGLGLAVGGSGAASGGGTTSLPTRTRPSSASGSGSRSGGGGGDDGQVVYNFTFSNVLPGSEREIARNIERALERARAQRGKGVAS